MRRKIWTKIILSIIAVIASAYIAAPIIRGLGCLALVLICSSNTFYQILSVLLVIVVLLIMMLISIISGACFDYINDLITLLLNNNKDGED